MVNNSQEFLKIHQVTLNVQELVCKIQDGADCFPLKQEDFNYKKEGVKNSHYFNSLKEFNTTCKIPNQVKFSLFSACHRYGALKISKGMRFRSKTNTDCVEEPVPRFPELMLPPNPFLVIFLIFFSFV